MEGGHLGQPWAAVWCLWLLTVPSCSWGSTAGVPPCLGSGPGHWSNSLQSKGNSLGNSVWNQYYIFVINLWGVCVLIHGAERSMSCKEDSTNCRSESSVLGWQRKVLLSECFKRADFHFCKSWCFKNLCQTIQSTKNYSLEEKSEYYDVKICFTILNFSLKWLFWSHLIFEVV